MKFIFKSTFFISLFLLLQFGCSLLSPDYELRLSLTPEGSKKIAEITLEKNRGRALAIQVNDYIYSAPVINEVIPLK